MQGGVDAAPKKKYLFAMVDTIKAIITIFVAFSLVGCSTDSTQAKTERELVLGCESIQSDFGIKLNDALPHFAKAARMNPEYLVLIDKVGQARETDLGYRTYKATQAESWLYAFCYGLDE